MKAFLVFLLFATVFSKAQAQVTAMPSHQFLGPVVAPASATASVTFMNASEVPVPDFYVNCRGDLSNFKCESSCGPLLAHGSCTVTVLFTARFKDGQTKKVSVEAMRNGAGIFAEGEVSAVDELNSHSDF